MSNFLSIHLFVTYFNTITNQFWLTLLFPLPVISLLDYSKNYPSHFFNIYWTRIINARWHAIPNVDDPLSKNTLYLPFTHIIFIILLRWVTIIVPRSLPAIALKTARITVEDRRRPPLNSPIWGATMKLKGSQVAVSEIFIYTIIGCLCQSSTYPVIKIN